MCKIHGSKNLYIEETIFYGAIYTKDSTKGRFKTTVGRIYEIKVVFLNITIILTVNGNSPKLGF